MIAKPRPCVRGRDLLSFCFDHNIRLEWDDVEHRLQIHLVQKVVMRPNASTWLLTAHVDFWGVGSPGGADPVQHLRQIALTGVDLMMMEIEYDRHAATLGRPEDLLQAKESLVVLQDHTAADLRGQRFERLHQTCGRGVPVSVDASSVDHYLVRVVKLHQIEQFTGVDEFVDCPANDAIVGGIKDRVLPRMAAEAEAKRSVLASDGGETTCDERSPIEVQTIVRSQRNRRAAQTKEPERTFCHDGQDPLQVVQILVRRLCQSGGREVGQAEGVVRAQRAIGKDTSETEMADLSQF